MNPGGEPERDDTGLPPVEIEIPDDARELDRDVQAYYREQRAQRRRQRRRRLHGSLAKDGIVLPLLACFLILALIGGTLLTVFSATSDQNFGGGIGTGRPASTPTPAPTPVTVSTNLPLPHATIAVGGQPRLPAQELKNAVLVLVPAGCGCAATVNWLTDLAAKVHAGTYLIYTPATRADIKKLYGQLDSRQHPKPYLALETDGVLQRSAQGTVQTQGLVAILLGPTQLATYATQLAPGDDSTWLVKAFTR